MLMDSLSSFLHHISLSRKFEDQHLIFPNGDGFAELKAGAFVVLVVGVEDQLRVLSLPNAAVSLEGVGRAWTQVDHHHKGFKPCGTAGEDEEVVRCAEHGFPKLQGLAVSKHVDRPEGFHHGVAV